MDDTAQNITATNGTIDGWQVEWQWCYPVKNLMRSPLVVALAVFGENSSQVGLMQHNEPTQALLAQGPNRVPQRLWHSVPKTASE